MKETEAEVNDRTSLEIQTMQMQSQGVIDNIHIHSAFYFFVFSSLSLSFCFALFKGQRQNVDSKSNTAKSRCHRQ